MKLTPEELARKKQRDNLISLCNRIASAFSFKTVKTWGDVYRFTTIPTGTPPDKLSTAITFPELKEYFKKLQDELDTTFVTQAAIKDAPIQAVLPAATTPEPPLIVNPSDIPSVDNDYLLPKTTREHKDLIRYWFQRKAAKDCLDNILIYDKRGQQIVAAAGYGKTFVVGAVLCRLRDKNFAEGKTFGHIQYLYVTKNTVVEQTKRVFEKMFNLTIRDGFEVINYEQLRSKAGQLWVKEKVVVEGGEEKIYWEWRKLMNPVVIVWDENQSLKNYGSLQHQIACQFNEITTPTYQIFVSATPYMRVVDAKCFVVSTRKDITSIVGTPAKISNTNWPTYANSVAGRQSNPEEYNEAAVERLTKDLEPYIVRIKGVRPQFHAINSVRMINFDSPAEKKYYDDTEERYIREKEKLDAAIELGQVEGGGIHHLVLLTKRAIAAEFCRRNHFAKFAVETNKAGFAAAIAVKYKTTLIPVVKILCDEYGMTRDQISLVWGGGQTQLTKKQKTKAQIEAKEEALKAIGMSKEEILKSLDLEDVEDRVLEELPEELKLGAQSKEQRQREIDRFQAGITCVCIYTFKAGGVGLSLHHTDELTKAKVRRQKNGYAILEDIPNIPTRPRKTALSVAYSGIDMVQSIGRVPRMTSLSDTEQFCFLYNGTVEVDIAHVYSSKLRCLNKVTKNVHESWIDIIIGGIDRARLVEEHTKNDVPSNDDEDTGDLTDGEDE